MNVHIVPSSKPLPGVAGIAPAARLLVDAAEAADVISALGHVIAVARNAEVFGEGEPADHVYVVVSGVIRICKLLGDGRRQIEAFCMPGDAFGWERGLTHRFSAEAVSEGRLVRIKRSVAFTRACDDVNVSQCLWALTFDELHRAQDHLLLLGRKSAQERVAAFLLDLSYRAARKGQTGRELVLPMSRQDIADYLGLTIETVSRTLSALEDSGLIALPASRKVVLKDSHALRHLES